MLSHRSWLVSFVFAVKKIEILQTGRDLWFFRLFSFFKGIVLCCFFFPFQLEIKIQRVLNWWKNKKEKHSWYVILSFLFFATNQKPWQIAKAPFTSSILLRSEIQIYAFLTQWNKKGLFAYTEIMNCNSLQVYTMYIFTHIFM